MYPFGTDFQGKDDHDETLLYESPIFQRHAKGVVKMLDEVVNMLGPDLEPVTSTLTELGARHVSYGVLPAHYGIVGEALLYTLRIASGGENHGWNSRVEQGWVAVYSFVSTAMMEGANHKLKMLELRRRRIRKKKIEQVTSSSLEDPESDLLLSSTKSPRTKSSKKQIRKGSSVKSIIANIPGLKKKNRSSTNVEKASLFSNKEQVMDVIDNVLDVSNGCLSWSSETDDSTQSTTTPTSTASTTAEDDDGDEEDFHLVIDNVYRSWDKIKAIPDYEKVAGVLLFKK